jgi:hypothetical protein
MLYYVLFVMMSRKRYAANYTTRSRILAVLAAIVMVGCVPFHYANTVLGVAAMIGLAILALLSAVIDSVTVRRR